MGVRDGDRSYGNSSLVRRFGSLPRMPDDRCHSSLGPPHQERGAFDRVAVERSGGIQLRVPAYGIGVAQISTIGNGEERNDAQPCDEHGRKVAAPALWKVGPTLENLRTRRIDPCG